MATIRRVYIYLVCAITLQALTWSIIALVRDIDPFGPRAEVTTIAFQMAVILVTLPIFLVHWLWAQRLARNEEERGDVWRRLYLYGMLGVFLFAIMSQVLDLLTIIAQFTLGPALGETRARQPDLTATLADAIIATLVLGVFWSYQQWTVYRDERTVASTGPSATVRRFYVLSFSALGLTLGAFGLTQLVRWTLFQFGTRRPLPDVVVSEEIPRLLVGAALWLVFWMWAQMLFNGPSESERESALRKFYLYLVIFASSFGAVLGAAVILEEIIRQAFGLSAGLDVRHPFSVILTTTALWVYHYTVLRADASRAGEMPRQAGIRRLYLYLVAGIGLAAVLAGLVGEGNVLIRVLAGDPLGMTLKELLSWATSALIVGLPVWLIPWRRLQKAAVAPGPGGAEERRSVVRKIYLYLYIFAATMTVLLSAIYILSQLLSVALGARVPGNLILDLSQAFGFAIIAVGVWLYHGFVLRGDGKLGQRERAARLESMTAAVVDLGDGKWGCAALDALKREFPGLKLQPIGLNPAAASAMGAPVDAGAAAAALSSADLIVGSWKMAAGNGQVSSEMARAIAASPARKLLVPFWVPGWDWVGVDRMDDQALVRQTARAVKQILEAEEVRPAHSVFLAVVLIAVGACIAFQIIGFLLANVFASF